MRSPGRFEVVRPLWTGPYAVVEMARDGFRGDRPVTIKTIAPGRLPPRVMARLEREFTLRRRLRHPHLAELLDFEFDDGGACHLVREFVDGTDFVTWCERRDPTLVAEAATQVLQALAYLHDCGLVHGSIRPSNVLVVGGDRPDARLLDFDLLGDCGGTLEPVDRFHYSAPEVIRGEVRDARSDLYAFGMLLLHALDGRLPFDTQTKSSVVAWHLGTQVRRTPAGGTFARVIQRLLDPDPEMRFNEAPQVVRAIGTEVGRRFRPRVPRNADQLLVTGRFVGRERELRKLEDVCRRVFNGSGGRFFLVSGPRGIGKTRMLTETRVQAQIAGIRVIEARCMRDGGAPFGVVRDLVRQLLTLLGDDDPLVDAHRAALTAVLPEQFGADPTGVSRTLPAADAWLRVKNGVTDFIAATADVRPLLVLVDDLQWIDDPSAAVLRWLSNTFRGGPFMVVAALEDRETPRSGDSALSCLVDEEHEILRLRPLTPPDIEAMLGAVLAIRGSARELTDLIVRITNGVPLYVEELLRSLVDGDLLPVLGDNGAETAAGRADPARAGERAAALVGSRMQRLGDDCRPVLAALSLFEGRTAIDELCAACGLGRDAVLAAVLALDLAEVVTSLPGPAGPTVEWRSEVFRQVASTYLVPGQIVLLHDRVVQHLLTARGGSPDWCARLAHHAGLGSRTVIALDATLAAARQAMGLFSVGRARLLLERARELARSTGDAAARREILDLLSEVCERTGDLDGARGAYDELRELGTSGPETGIHALLRIGDIESASGRHAAADRTLLAAGEEAQRVGDRRLMSRVEAAMARSLLRRERFRDARDHFEKARALLDPVTDPSEEAALLADLGTVDWQLGDLGTSRLNHRRSLALALRTRDRVLVTSAHLNIAMVDWKSGRTHAAIRRLTRAERLAWRLGHYPLRAQALQGRGAIELELGRISSAVQTLTQSLSVRNRLGDDAGIGETLVLLATAHGLAGRHGTSRQLLDDALARATRRNESRLVLRARVALGRLLVVTGAFDEAETVLRAGAQSSTVPADADIAATAWLGLYEIALERGGDGTLEFEAGSKLATGGRIALEFALIEAHRLLLAGAVAASRQRVASVLLAARRARDVDLGARGRWLAGLVRNDESAVRSFDAAIRAASRSGLRELLWQVHRDQGALLLELGRVETARRTLRDGMLVLRAIHDGLPAAERDAYLATPRRHALKSLLRQALEAGAVGR